jgi:translation initiation factor IF-2
VSAGGAVPAVRADAGRLQGSAPDPPPGRAAAGADGQGPAPPAGRAGGRTPRDVGRAVTSGAGPGAAVPRAAAHPDRGRHRGGLARGPRPGPGGRPRRLLRPRRRVPGRGARAGAALARPAGGAVVRRLPRAPDGRGASPARRRPAAGARRRRGAPPAGRGRALSEQDAARRLADADAPPGPTA